MGIGRLERLNVRVACLAPGQNSTARGLVGLSKQKPRPWWGNWRSICVWHCLVISWLYFVAFSLPGKNHQGLTALSKTQTQAGEDEIGQEHQWYHRATSDPDQQPTKKFWESHREENTKKEIAEQALRMNDTVFAQSDSIRWHRAGPPPQQIGLKVIF